MSSSLRIAEQVDYWALEYLQNPLLEQLICPICQTVLVDACSTKCGHTFCNKCITDAIELHEQENPDTEDRPFRCPVDRQPLSGLREIRPSAFLITSLINELVVRCPFRSRGCAFQGKRWLLDTHLEQDCLYAMVHCGGTKENGEICDLLVERGVLLKYIDEERDEEIKERDDLIGISVADTNDTSDTNDYISETDIGQEKDRDIIYPSSVTNFGPEEKPIDTPEDTHDIDSRKCIHEPIPCPKGCGQSVIRHELKEHYANSCSNVTAQCLACKMEMPQPELEAHQQECAEGLVECMAKRFGCPWTGKRKDVRDAQKHSSSCLFVSLFPVLGQHERRIDMLERENATLRSHVERLSSQAVGKYAGDSRSPSSQREDLMHLMLEAQKLRLDVDYIITTIGEMDIKQGMMMMRENVRTQEELGLLRNGFNNLRNQVHFLLAERRSWSLVHHGGSHISEHPQAPPLLHLHEGSRTGKCSTATRDAGYRKTYNANWDHRTKLGRGGFCGFVLSESKPRNAT